MSSLSYANSKNDREYFIAIKIEYKILEKKYLITQKELQKWEKRIKLAKENSKTTLQAEAERQVENIQNSINHLINELIELKFETEKALQSIQKTPEQPAIDPVKLLKKMEEQIQLYLR